MPTIFDIKLVFTQIPALLEYLPVTLLITAFSMIAGVILGFAIALIRIKRIWLLNSGAGVFVSFIRGTPLIVQLYLTYYGIPILLKYYNYYNQTDYSVNDIPTLLFVLLAFSLNEAAYNSESIRAALLSVDKKQIEAAQSLGMTPLQVLRRVTIPEAFVVALPTLGNALIGLLKGTSLAFVCSVIELTARGKILASSNYRYFEVYVSLALIYWGLTIIIEALIKVIEARIRIPERPLVNKGAIASDRH
ncbi:MULTISPECIES: amino acid ABC transporter permease [unclassified Symbiopectobacterium]|uniref:amino acid ABC transporter permease n=1 Tax=unclassified Symbiopectobacterium TaxID=2794573 RepID=UPI0022264147|nr:MULTISPECIES: amino acid ABC transporter permease [unclassified Symbiopectobacterium]MCW2473977.1 amino acid ABC transporter permease [Candidatus Symbiopectobacterium sp. NZEC151]MCW2485220.1 amino acid ABC transporter permease [Candidatus Symbiopectobacterium sp. NZEC127]